MKKKKVLGDEHPVLEDDEDDLDPTYSKDTSKD